MLNFLKQYICLLCLLGIPSVFAQEEQLDQSTIVIESGPADLANAPSGEYRLDMFHKYLVITYDHRGLSTPHILWRDFDVRVNLNHEVPENTSFNVTVQASSVDTGSDIFDGHMQNYFETEKYPEITFTSTSYEATGPETGKAHGVLTIRDISNPVTLDIKINHAGKNQDPIYGMQSLGITATGKIQRANWKILERFHWIAPEMSIRAEVELLDSNEFGPFVERINKMFRKMEE